MPVVWSEPPSTPWLTEGVLVVVAGRVHRRFFRAGGLTQSRTEVVAEHVATRRQTARSRQVVEQALRRGPAVLTPPLRRHRRSKRVFGH